MSRIQEGMLSEDTLSAVNRSADTLREVVSAIESPACRAANTQILLITGTAGSGKTHLLLRSAERLAASGHAVYLLFADHFRSIGQIQDGKVRQGLDRSYSLEEVVDELDRLGQSNETRSLLLIDALNETTPCDLWKSGLDWLETTLARHPNVAVALTVRTGFEQAVASQPTLSRVLRVDHPGFSQDMWAAVDSFFTGYKIPSPRVPLLEPEFSNPLFLRLFCIAHQGKRPERVWGRVGATGLFEDYAKAVGRAMNRELGRPRDSNDRVWKQLIKPIAVWMGSEGKEAIPYKDAVVIADAAYPKFGEKALVAAERHSLLVKSPRYSSNGEVYQYVYKFTYQKFSDHLIVRYLLKEHFEPSNPRSGFGPNTRLAAIANSEMGSGLLEALAIQIPEWTNAQWELPDLVSSEAARSYPMCIAFLDSLVWRNPTMFGPAAREYINTHINSDQELLEELFERLLSVAATPDYQLNARTLHTYLAKIPLHDRDQLWTRWLRYRYQGGGSVVDRLVTWASRVAYRAQLEPESVVLASVALCWLFTTPNRFLRDDATKSLVALLSNYPAAVPEVLSLFSEVNDPYVLERVYGAAFGALTRNPQPAATDKSAAIALTSIFASTRTTHLLTRDYARGIVELAVTLGLLDTADAESARPPYSSKFPDSIPTIDELRCTYGDHEGNIDDYGSLWTSIMSWDFARYVIGTNTSSTPWSRTRIGGCPPESPAVKWVRFEEGLSPPARTAYAEWRDSTAAADFAELTAGLLEEESADPSSGVRAVEALDNLQRLLSPAETLILDELQHAPPHFARDDTFDLEIEQRWVFLRCLELGWTKGRFGSEDKHRGHGDHGDRKIERIGKKYQWIAHYEFLGLLADNFALRPEWGQLESPQYGGPWIEFYRDIDPTSLADGLPNHHGNSWCCSPDYDPEDFSGSDIEWLSTIDDIPNLAAVIQKTDTAGSSWFTLEGLYEWKRPPAPGQKEYDQLHRYLWAIVQAYLVPIERASEFSLWCNEQNFIGRWMPESSSIDSVYLREYPRSEAFRYLKTVSDEVRNGWVSSIRGSNLDIPLLVATDRYSGRPVNRDCSVKESFTICLPANKLVLDLEMRHGRRDGQWLVGDTLTAFDPSVDTDQSGCVLFEASTIHKYLANNRLALVWTVMAEKQLVGGWNQYRGSRPTEISGCYVLGADGPCGSLRLIDVGDPPQPIATLKKPAGELPSGQVTE